MKYHNIQERNIYMCVYIYMYMCVYIYIYICIGICIYEGVSLVAQTVKHLPAM